MLDYGITIALSAVALFAVSTIIQKKVVDSIRDVRTAVYVVGFGIIPLLIIYLAYSSSISAYALAIAAVSGIFFMGGDFLYFKSLEKVQVANAYSIGLVQPMLILGFSVIALGEHLTMPEVVGGAIILFGVTFLDTEKKRLRFDRKLTPALLGNVSWAVYWMFLASSINASGQIATPIIVSRITAFIAIILVYLIVGSRRSEGVRRKINYKRIAVFGALTGILDGAGNGIYAITVTLHQLSVASLVMLIGPFIVIALAYLFYRERLSKVQLIGLLAAAAGAVVLAIG